VLAILILFRFLSRGYIYIFKDKTNKTFKTKTKHTSSEKALEEKTLDNSEKFRKHT